MDQQLSLFPGIINMQRLHAEAETLIQRGQRAANTARMYRSGWCQFRDWCVLAGREPLPASEDTLCCFLVSLLEQGRKISTLRSYVAAVRQEHVIRDLIPPGGLRLTQLLAGVARKNGQQAQPKRVITVAELRSMLAALDRGSAPGARDAAVLLLGFSTGLRRSDLVALNMSDLRFDPQGVIVSVGRGLVREKNDQTGEGRDIGVNRESDRWLCPVRALEQWIERRGPEPGPVFLRCDGRGRPRQRSGLNPATVAAIVHKAAAAAGLDAELYAAHSLRAGMITAAHLAGASDSAIMHRSGHKTPAAMRRYIRAGNPFAADPLAS